MKSLQRPSFFRMFDLLLGTTNPGFKLTRWTHDGVEFERERHSFSSPRHGLTIEIVIKNLRWARPLGGQRGDLFAWLRVQEAALERASISEQASRRADKGVSEKERNASIDALGLQDK